MPPFEHLLPAAVRQFVEWATSDPDLAAIHLGNVGSRLAGGRPALRVQRVSGSPNAVWEDTPVLQIEAWGSTETQADDLVRAVVAALPRFRGSYAAGLVHGHRIESGPFWAPDAPGLSNDARYILTVRTLTTP